MNEADTAIRKIVKTLQMNWENEDKLDNIACIVQDYFRRNRTR